MQGKVVVIGAGNAGLAAAYELEKAGVDYVVLEATSRYGGRVGRGDFEHGTYSMGAYFTEPQWDTTFEYLQEFGIMADVTEITEKVYGMYLNGKVAYFSDTGNLAASLFALKGLPLSIVPQGAKFVPSLMKAMGLVDAEKQDFSKLAEISRYNAKDWVTEHGGDQIADKFVGPLLKMMVLAQGYQISAAHPIALMKLMAGMCLIKGGLKRINDTIYEMIKDKVRLSTPVEKVEIEDDVVKGVKLANGEYIETDTVICCTDAVDALAIMPNLPESIAEPLDTCQYSKTWHYVFYTPERDTPDNFLSMFIPDSSDSKLDTIFDENSNNMAATPGTGLIHAFTSSEWDEEFKQLDDEARCQLVMDEVGKFYPGFADRAELVSARYLERAVNIEAPGQFEAIEELKKNHIHDVKGLHLGGEYLFLIASTEGAWRTGKAAGKEVAEEKAQN